MKFGESKGGRHLPKVMSQLDYVELLENTRSWHHKVGMMLAFESGLRISEVINLQQNHIDVENKRIRVIGGKGDKDRITKLPKSWQDYHMPMIPLGCTRRALQSAFDLAARKAGLKDKIEGVSFHSLRHGFATHLRKKNVKLETIQALLGHNDISTTTIYLHASPEEAIAEAEEKW